MLKVHCVNHLQSLNIIQEGNTFRRPAQGVHTVEYVWLANKMDMLGKAESDMCPVLVLGEKNHPRPNKKIKKVKELIQTM